MIDRGSLIVLALFLAAAACFIGLSARSPCSVDARIARNDLSVESVYAIPGLSNSVCSRIVALHDAGIPLESSLIRFLPNGTASDYLRMVNGGSSE